MKQGMVAKEEGRLTEARACFEQAVESDPSNWEAHWGLAWVLTEYRTVGLAQTEFQRVAELAPSAEIRAEARKAAQRIERTLSTPAEHSAPVYQLPQTSPQQGYPTDAYQTPAYPSQTYQPPAYSPGAGGACRQRGSHVPGKTDANGRVHCGKCGQLM